MCIGVRTPEYLHIPKLGCLLIETMLANPVARKHQFFMDFVVAMFRALFDEVDVGTGMIQREGREAPHALRSPTRSMSIVGLLPVTSSPPPAKENRWRPFSRENLQTKLSREYFSFIRIISRDLNADMFFNSAGFFAPRTYRMASHFSKDYLCRMIIQSLSYSSSKQKMLLDSWVRAGSVPLRLFAVSQLRLLLRNSLLPENIGTKAGDFSWGLKLLCSQLQTTSGGVHLAALSVGLSCLNE